MSKRSNYISQLITKRPTWLYKKYRLNIIGCTLLRNFETYLLIFLNCPFCEHCLSFILYVYMLRYIVEVSQMRTITKISKQKNKSNRYNIYLDDTFAFGVDEDVLLKNKLRKGLELTNEQITKLLDDESIQNAYLLAVRYLSYRIRTKLELQIYLRKKEIDEMIIEQTIERLKKEKLVNDAQFAQSFVRDRMNQTSDRKSTRL